MEREAVCPVCGKEFMADRSTQRYCSAACRRYAYRHRDEAPPAQRACGKTVRSFRCLRCGTLVFVRNRADKRVKFCSPRCERLYWKHSETTACQAVPRTFSCKQCGKTVVVAEPKDRRTSFCSAGCRIQWFSAHRKRAK